MKKREHIRRIYAWMLLLTFAFMLTLKGAHYHTADFHADNLGKMQQTTGATIKASCVVCDFVFQKATAFKPTVFIKPLTSIPLKRFVFVMQTVYRQILSVNTNSPPLF